MPKKASFSDKIFCERTFFFSIIVLIFLARFVSGFVKKFDHDEFEALHSAWKLFDGGIIYVNFFQHHHPLLYYVLTGIIKIFGEGIRTLFAAKVFIYILFALMLRVSYSIAFAILKDKTASLIATIFLLSFYPIESSYDIRPDSPQLLFCLLCFLYYITGLNNVKKNIISGCCLAIGFLFLQKTLFFGFAIFIIQLIDFRKGRLTIKNMAVFWGAFCCALLPYYSYLLYHGYFLNYWFFNWIFNKKFIVELNLHGAYSPDRWHTIFLMFIESLPIWYFFFRYVFSKKIENKICLALSLILFIVISIFSSPFIQNYLVILPFVSIAAAQALLLYVKNKKVIAAVVCLSFLPTFVGTIYSMTFGEKNTHQLQVIAYVLDNTKPGDYVYDGDINFNLFRKDIDFFWFSVRPNRGALRTYQKMRPYPYDIYKSIETFKPKFISTNYLDVSNPVIANEYTLLHVGETPLMRRRD